MPIIYPNDERLPDGLFFGSTTFSAYLSISHDLEATFDGKTTISATTVAGAILLEALIEGSTDFDAEFPEGPMAAEFDGSTEFTASLRPPVAEEHSFTLFLQHIPLNTANARINRKLPRLKADGVEIPIKRWQVSEPQTGSGKTLQVVLARVSDRDAFGPDTVIEFGLGLRTDGIWDESSFVCKFDSAIFQGKTLAVRWNGRPDDEVTVNVISSATDKFLRAADTDLVVYDPNKMHLEVADFEPIVDTEGRIYPTEIEPHFNMTSYDMFGEMLLDRCGFSGYHTNLPEWPISRVDCNMGDTFFNSMAGYIGMFSPVIFVKDDEVWILDTTLAAPAGFPSPRDVLISEYKELTIDDQRQRLDALLVQYVEDSLGYDFITTRTEIITDTVGPCDLLTQRLFKEYRRFSQPNVIVREEMYHEDRTVTDATVGTIAFTNEDTIFDSMNKLTGRSKTTDTRVPDLNNAGALTLLRTKEETESVLYAPHPFQPKKMFVSRREYLTRGLIATDSTNQQLGEDFERAIEQSYRSGNVSTDMTSRFGDLKSKVEIGEPLRGGQVKTTTIEVDHLSNTPTIDDAVQDPGDISINGLSPTQKKVLVFDDENTLRARDHVEQFHIGELPITFGIPLARRVLKLRKLKAGTSQMTTFDYDESLKKGSVFNAKFRDGNDLGQYVILGINSSGGYQQITKQTFQAKRIG